MSLFATRTTLAYSKSQPSPSHLKLWSHDIVWLWLIAETFYSVIDLTCPACLFSYMEDQMLLSIELLYSHMNIRICVKEYVHLWRFHQ